MTRWIILGLAATLSAVVAAELPTLADAAKNSDKAALRLLLKPGVNVNASQGDGTTALHWASYRDDLEAADLLIRAGANVNAVNDLGVTPLWAASQNGSVAMVRKLLAAGANPNAKLESGETLVMTAARAGKADVLELLLAKGADPNARGIRGQTALMWAAAQQHPEATKVLLAHKADLNARSDVWTQLWQTAPEQDVHPDYQVNVKLGGDTPLLFAARAGDLESAKLLVAAGANVNDESAYGTSAAVLATHSGNVELLRFLLDKDANPNASTAGYTALHAAILRANPAAVAVLLEHGADANAKLRASTPVRRESQDYYFHPAFVGATPFWLAARFGQPETMRLLAQHGADPSFVQDVTIWGRRGKNSEYAKVKPGAITPLMAALGMGRGAGFRAAPPNEREPRALECVKVAVEAGAPINAADADGRTALENATAMGYKSVVEYLTSKGAKLDHPARPLRREPVEN
jgi:ankyrin repeat protein